MKDVQKGTTNSVEEPSVLKESPATALVDGNNLLGPVVGNFCMKLAIQKAKEVGIGLVVAQRSTHYGKHRQLFRNYFLTKMKKVVIPYPRLYELCETGYPSGPYGNP